MSTFIIPLLFSFFVTLLLIHFSFLENDYARNSLNKYKEDLIKEESPNLLKYQIWFSAFIFYVFTFIQFKYINSSTESEVLTSEVCGLVSRIAFFCLFLSIGRVSTFYKKASKRDLIVTSSFILSLLAVPFLTFVSGLFGNEKVTFQVQIVSFLGYFLLSHLLYMTWIVVSAKKKTKKYWKLQDMIIAFLVLLTIVITIYLFKENEVNSIRPLSLILASIVLALTFTKHFYEYNVLLMK